MNPPRRSQRFTEMELDGFRERLERLKGGLQATEESLEREGLKGFSEQGTGEISSARLHPADLATNEFERDLSLSLAENEIHEIRDIEEALTEIQNQTYGVCRECGQEIALGRLEALPYARLCGACEVKLERERKKRSLSSL